MNFIAWNCINLSSPSCQFNLKVAMFGRNKTKRKVIEKLSTYSVNPLFFPFTIFPYCFLLPFPFVLHILENIYPWDIAIYSFCSISRLTHDKDCPKSHFSLFLPGMAIRSLKPIFLLYPPSQGIPLVFYTLHTASCLLHAL